MKVATWNVNSVRKRTGNLVAWLEHAKPDVVVLQEIKAQEAQFPRLEVEAAGYKVEIVGQKGFNGVALLSLHPVEITARSLPDAEPDEPARYIEGKMVEGTSYRLSRARSGKPMAPLKPVLTPHKTR